MRYRVDPQIENEGVWFEYPHVRVKCARESENNRAFKEYMTREYKKIGTAIRVGMLSNEKASAMLKEAYARTIVKDWETADQTTEGKFVKGVELRVNGKFEIVPVTPENIIEYFNDPANVDTFNALRLAAQSSEPYRETLEDEQIKN